MSMSIWHCPDADQELWQSKTVIGQIDQLAKTRDTPHDNNEFYFFVLSIFWQFQGKLNLSGVWRMVMTGKYLQNLALRAIVINTIRLEQKTERSGR